MLHVVDVHAYTLVVANSHCVELVSWPISVAELEWEVRFYLCSIWNGIDVNVVFELEWSSM